MSIVELIFLLLGVALLIVIFKHPYQIFVVLPAGILRASVHRFLSIIQFITIPVWLPIYFIDEKFKWGVFEHKFFKIFNRPYSELDDEDLPDIQYSSGKIRLVHLNDYKTYLITSFKDPEKLKRTIIDGIETLGNEVLGLNVFSSKSYCIVELKSNSLYEFFYLIQWLNQEFKKTKNFAYAISERDSFFGMQDENSLNNIVGRTSDKHQYYYSLYEADVDRIMLKQDLSVNPNFTTSFFHKLVKQKSHPN